MRIATPAAVVVAAIAALGGTNATADIAPFGGVGTVAVSPTTGRVLVGIDEDKAGSCLWWSDDQGADWHVARGLGKFTGVTALAFSPSQPSIAYAGVIREVPGSSSLGSGVLASSDGGGSWHAVSWRQRIRGGPAAIYELVVDPSRPSTVYADTNGVLRRTLDGGKTWTLARTGLPPLVDRAPLDQQVVADAGGTLYYATGRARGHGQIYRSTSRGGSWRPAGHGLPAAPPGSRLLQLASDLTGPPGSVYAAGFRGLYATRNAGRTWTRILRRSALTVNVGPAGVFVLAVGAVLLRRSSAGSWTRLNGPPIDETYAFALDPTNSSQLYAWSYIHVHRQCATLFGSGDSGATWASIGGALPLAHCSG